MSDVDGPPVLTRILDGGIALVTMSATMFTAEPHGRSSAERSTTSAPVTTSASSWSPAAAPRLQHGRHARELASLAAGEGSFTDEPFLYEGLLRCGRPVVTALQGHAAGGGLAFGLFGDVVVIVREGEYRANFLQYGFTPGVGATYVLERRFGAALATEMMLTGRALTGTELARRGADVNVVARRRRAVHRPGARPLGRRQAAGRGAGAQGRAGRRALRRLPEVIEREADMHRRVLGGEPRRVEERPHGAAGRGRASRRRRRPGPSRWGRRRGRAARGRGTGRGGSGGETSRPGRRRRGRARRIGIVRGVLYLDAASSTSAGPSPSSGSTRSAPSRSSARSNRGFGIDLDSVAVYDHPTLDDLTEAVAAEMGRHAELTAAATAAPEPAAGAEPVPQPPQPVAVQLRRRSSRSPSPSPTSGRCAPR